MSLICNELLLFTYSFICFELCYVLSMWSETTMTIQENEQFKYNRQIVLTANKINRSADQIKKTISSLDEEVEVLINKQRK